MYLHNIHKIRLIGDYLKAISVLENKGGHSPETKSNGGRYPVDLTKPIIQI